VSYRKRKDRKDYWLIDVSLDGQRYYGKAKSEEGAKLEEARLIQQAHKDREEAKNPVTGKPKAWTFKYAAEEVQKNLWTGTRSETKNKQCVAVLRAFYTDDAALDSFTLARVDDLRKHMKEKGNKPSYINRVLAVLSKILSWSEARGGMAEAKRPTISPGKITAKRIRFLNPEEERDLLRYARVRGELIWEACVVLLDTGMRVGELLNLQARDCNFFGARAVASVWENKGDKPRSVPMTDRVLAILKDRAKAHPNGSLFPMTYDAFAAQFIKARKAMKLAKADSFNIHTLRHTYASRLAQRGLSLDRIQALLGHATLTMTLRYAHLRPSDLMGAADLLETVQQEAGQKVSSAAVGSGLVPLVPETKAN